MTAINFLLWSLFSSDNNIHNCNMLFVVTSTGADSFNQCCRSAVQYYIIVNLCSTNSIIMLYTASKILLKQQETAGKTGRSKGFGIVAISRIMPVNNPFTFLVFSNMQPRIIKTLSPF